MWEKLLDIPMGKLTTYADLAAHAGAPKAARAVGAAVGKNPICFVVPCHRVIGKDGEIGAIRSVAGVPVPDFTNLALGMALAQQNHFAEAVQSLQTFVTLAPLDPQTAKARAIIAELQRANP